MRPNVHKSKRGNVQVMTSCLLSSNLHINLLQSRWRRNEEEELDGAVCAAGRRVLS